MSSIAFVWFCAMFEAIVAQALGGGALDVPDAIDPPDAVPDIFTPDPLLETDPLVPAPAGKGSSAEHDEAMATIPSATKGAQPSR
jgi:hypothetical protein